MMDERPFSEIKAAHPFPWTFGMYPPAPGEPAVMLLSPSPRGPHASPLNNVRMLDASNAEVPLFTVLRLAHLVSAASVPIPTPTEEAK